MKEPIQALLRNMFSSFAPIWWFKGLSVLWRYRKACVYKLQQYIVSCKIDRMENGDFTLYSDASLIGNRILNHRLRNQHRFASIKNWTWFYDLLLIKILSQARDLDLDCFYWRTLRGGGRWDLSFNIVFCVSIGYWRNNALHSLPYIYDKSMGDLW